MKLNRGNTADNCQALGGDSSQKADRHARARRSAMAVGAAVAGYACEDGIGHWRQ